MSLLDRGAPHTVEVLARESVRDTGGRRVYNYVGAPVTHRCHVEPARDWSAAEEAVSAGLQVLDMRVLYSRAWSGDEYSHIRWEGDLYEMVGAPQHFSVSRRTAHWRVTMRRIGAAT